MMPSHSSVWLDFWSVVQPLKAMAYPIGILKGQRKAMKNPRGQMVSGWR